MSPLFSKAAAATSTDIIYRNVARMLQNVDQQIKSRGFADMYLNWLAMNCDSLTDSFMDQGMGLLKDENKARAWAETVDSVATGTPFAKQFTWFIPMSIKLSMWVLERLTPEVSRLVKLRRVKLPPHPMLGQFELTVAFLLSEYDTASQRSHSSALTKHHGEEKHAPQTQAL